MIGGKTNIFFNNFQNFSWKLSNITYLKCVADKSYTLSLNKIFKIKKKKNNLKTI